MTGLLVYRNSTPELMAWAEDFAARDKSVGERREAFADGLAQAHGVTVEVGTFSRGLECVGISWPPDAELPPGWYRPAGEDPRMIRPHMGRKAGKVANAELAQLGWPDARAELSRKFGMSSLALIPDTNRYYTPGLRREDDGVWVTWGSRDVVTVLGDVESHGWVRVPLAEYIERFGEDAL